MPRWPTLFVTSLLLILVVPTALAWIVPGTFILDKVAETWKDSRGLVVERELTRPDGSKGLETLYLQNGRVRLERSGSIYLSASPTPSPPHPLILDGVFGLKADGLARTVSSLGIAVDQVSLQRLPTPQAPLPFVVLYRLGGEHRRGIPQLMIEKDRWLIRRLQLKDSSQDALWYAEYSDFGTLPGLPAWYPARTELYLDGSLVESLRVIRRIQPDPKDSHFQPAAGTP